MRIQIVLVLALAMTACSKKREVVSTGQQEASPATSSTVAAVPPPVLGGVGQADSLVFTLQRTPCFGACKVYVINVYRSGYATYDGRANVEPTGKHYAYIGPDVAKALLDDAERSGFFALEDVYDRDVTDLPSSIMRVVGKGRDKRVVARVGTPESFRELFGRAEQTLFSMPWKPLPQTK